MKNISLDALKASLLYFSKLNVGNKNASSTLFHFLILKRLGVNRIKPTRSLRSAGGRQEEQGQESVEAAKKALVELAAVFNPNNEVGGMKSAIYFPIDVAEGQPLIKANFYNQATSFKGLVGRLSDSFTNTTAVRNLLLIDKEEKYFRFAPDYLIKIKEELRNKFISIEHLVAWLFRFKNIDASDNYSAKELRNVCIFSFLNEYHITREEFANLFSFSDTELSFSDYQISGAAFRELLTFEEQFTPDITRKDEHDDILQYSLTESQIKQANSVLRDRIFNQEAILDFLPKDDYEDATQPLPSHKDESILLNDAPLNLIVCGAPGTGKSSTVQRKYETGRYVWKRITFHPEYSYFDFIGSYKPVPVYEKKSDELALLEANGQKLCEHGVPHINYQFVPGPFISLLVEAVLHPDKEHVLIIEEINRADAASVFGDILQVLDRNECGESRYAVDISPELQDFFMLKSTAGVADEIKKKLQLIANTGLKIPKNMRLVATMNGSDQGVQPLDAAFKRRWDFLYMPLEPASAANNHEVLRYSGGDYYWCDFVVALNDRLALDFSVPEDRLIGPYFIKPGQVGDLKAIQKLLLYLRDDIARHNPTFFNSSKRDLASLIKDFTVESADILGIKDKLPASLIVSTEAESSPSQDFTDFWNDFLQYVATREDIPSSYTPYVGNRDRNYLDFHIGPLPCATGITLRTCPKQKKAKVTLYTSPGKVDEFASLLTPHEAEITQAIQSGGQNRVEFKNEPKSGTTLVIETELSEDSNQNFKWFVDTAISLYNVLTDKLAKV